MPYKDENSASNDITSYTLNYEEAAKEKGGLSYNVDEYGIGFWKQ